MRAAAQSAQRAGIQVFAVDRFGDKDTLEVSDAYLRLPDLDADPQAFQSEFGSQLASWLHSMPFLVVGGIRGLERILNRLPLSNEKLSQLRTAREMQDSGTLRNACLGTPMRFPESWGVGESGSANFQVSGNHSESNAYLFKQRDQCGGFGVNWVLPNPTRRPDPQLLSELMQIHGPGILQKWIPGRLLGSSFLSNGKEVALLGTYRGSFTRVGDRPFIYNGSSGPIFLEDPIQQQILSIGSKLVKETGYRGVFNLDWIMGTSSQPFLIEVNARWSGSLELVERLWRSQLLHAKVDVPFKSVMDWAVEAIAGAPLPAFLARIQCSSNDGDMQKAAASSLSQSIHGISVQQSLANTLAPDYFIKRIVFSRRDQLFDPQCLPEDLPPSATLHDIPVEPTSVKRGEPLCTLIIHKQGGAVKEILQHYRYLVRCLSLGEW